MLTWCRNIHILISTSEECTIWFCLVFLSKKNAGKNYEIFKFINAWHRYSGDVIPTKVLDTVPIDTLSRTGGLPSEVRATAHSFFMHVVYKLIHGLISTWTSTLYLVQDETTKTDEGGYTIL